MDTLSASTMAELNALKSAYRSGGLNDQIGPPSIKSLYDLVRRELQFPFCLTVFKGWMHQ